MNPFGLTDEEFEDMLNEPENLHVDGSDSETEPCLEQNARKRKSYSAPFKLKVVLHAKRDSIHKASDIYKVDRATVRDWKQREQDLKEQVLNSTAGKRAKRLPGAGSKLKFQELDDQLAKWVRSEFAAKRGLSRRIVRNRAMEMFNAEADGTEFTASSEWLEGFLTRHKFSFRQRTTVCQKPPSDYAQKLVNFVLYVSNICLRRNWSVVGRAWWKGHRA
ncbi:tc5 transposase DNA-binding domain-containing protein [Ditylenchus destructor]|uniref:Tc5 transposase DNA-binding domain-containing protein n=1 Tax=Ditylenchus destructor TaxID=166010 RepID=A0AAD4MJI5_9BILA|nr:tc5 transposase DNA-binding domain-containing protein [Ditylenchus destructor]